MGRTITTIGTVIFVAVLVAYVRMDDRRVSMVEAGPSGDTVTDVGVDPVPDVEVHGGGASFPDVLYQVVNSDFNALVGREVVTYAKSGSVDGRSQLTAGTLDIAGSDSLPTPEEDLPPDVMYFPVGAAPIVVAFNLPGVEELSFGVLTLAAIFQGDIKNWNDPAIAADNPGAVLPSLPLHAVHRSDGSGTTRNFTTYLRSGVGDLWRLGVGDEIGWPAGSQGGEKNSGVAELVSTTVGSVGYVDLGDAAKAGLSIARVGNASGEFLMPTAEAAGVALEAVEARSDLTFDLIGIESPGAYPITAPTWLLVRAEQTPSKAQAIRSYLRHLFGPGQGLARSVGFVPLPPALLRATTEQISMVGS